MADDEFPDAVHRVADWMADYLDRVGRLPVVPDIAPGDVSAKIPPTPPDGAESFETILGDFERHIVPAMTHWNHPGWFAYFPANHSPPSILAEMLVAAMGAQCMSWATSPAATELEQVVMDWLRQMLGLPDEFVGVIQDTASSACLVALLCARERAAPTQSGVPANLTVYCSEEAHSSVDKAVRLSGIGLANLRKIPADPKTFAIDAEGLAAQVAADVADGFRPAFVVATVGTTSSGGVDPIEPLADVCEEHDIWLHVDAAYAGSAAILQEKRWILDGVERADSFNFNPHKWLLTNFDCSAYFVRDPAHLVETFSTDPEYLRTRHDTEVENFRDWGIALGRRFRALKLWFVIRWYGVDGLRRMLRGHIELAGWLADQVRDHAQLELIGEPHFGLVCFRAVAGEDATRALHRALNAHPEQYLTHTSLGGHYTIRASIGQWQTERSHVEHLWQTIEASL